MAKRWLTIPLTFAAIFFALEQLGRNGAWDNKTFPLPSEVITYLWENATDGVKRNATTPATPGATDPLTPATLLPAVAHSTLVEATLVTFKRLALGYLIGITLGIPLGLLTARFEFFRSTLGLIALGLQGLPSVCWVPLSLRWFGATESAILFVVVMGTLWSLMLATEHGLRTVPPLHIRAARTMGSKGLHLWTRVLVPAALPSVMGGMKQGWAFAWRSLMAAEIYVTILSGYGLGWLLHNGREILRMDQVLGVMLLIVLIGLGADHFLFAPVEKRLRARWGLDRQ